MRSIPRAIWGTCLYCGRYSIVRNRLFHGRASSKMADSTLKPSDLIVTPVYQSKINVNASPSSLHTSTYSFSSLRSSSCNSLAESSETDNVPLSAKAVASTTKNRVTVDNRSSRSKMAVETEAVSSRIPKYEEFDRRDATQDLPFIHQANETKKCVVHGPILKAEILSDETKHRRSNRYDSSESSDSGVVSLTCSDASSWSSSSDITEPVSPSSPTSSQPSPVSQSTPENNVEIISTSHTSTETDSINISDRKVDLNPSLLAKLNANEQVVGNSSFPELEATTCTSFKRHRRFSDSTAKELLVRQSPLNGWTKESGKRVRQLSGGEGLSSQPCISFDCDFDSSDRLNRNSNTSSSLTHLKRFTFLTRTSSKTRPCCLESNQNRRDIQFLTQRQSWPPSKCLLHPKSGQLKITEFFPAQVKHHWSYARYSNAESKNEKLQNNLSHSNWCSPPSASRVAIVSVAQIDQNNSHEIQINHPLLSNSNFEKSAATVPLDCLSPTKLQGIAPIRFPIDETSSCQKSDAVSSGTNVVQCLWQHCTSRLTSSQSLLEHIQSAHVASQALSSSSLRLWSTSGPDSATGGSTVTDEVYSCQWEGCKVKGRTSSSRAWLERHVLLHGGHKPFRCIVDLCEQRFNSQAALQRHVNAHFNQESGQSGTGLGLKRENAPAKIIRRNSKKLKNRRNKVIPARVFDYFDSGVMERLRHQLIRSHERPNSLDYSLLTDGLTVHSQVIARRLDSNGKSRVLLRWTPLDVLPDQWVPEDEIVTHKIVSFCNLDKSTQFAFRELFTLPTCPLKTGVKHRRKQ